MKNESSASYNSAERPPGQGFSREVIQNWLLEKLAAVLGVEQATLYVDEPFKNYGLASIDMVGLSGELEDWLGRALSPTIAYDYPSIALLARYLAGEQDTFLASQDIDAPAQLSEPIAIIGLACRFPAGAHTPESFWELLKHGRDAVSEIPGDRWNVDEYYDPVPNTPGKMYTRHGCFVQDLDHFDAHFFGISPREAMRMDPQQRLLVEVAWEALENAGLAVSELAGSPTGVFVGMMNNHEYAQLQIQQGDDAYLDDPYFGIGSAASIASGRLPYLFDFRGPTLAVDTACSSSLVAVHLACQSLRSGESTLALAAGVNAVMLPENMVNACKMGMLAVDGRCKTFDAAADGFVMGEGCGVVVLKRLARAQADGDPILAVIRGSAVNQDGRSNGITAPNRLAQEAVIKRALANASLDPHRVSYVEAHGSGTPLGDPIEIEAINTVLGRDRQAGQNLLVGSVKTNIGHLAGAAGIAGLIKTVLALQHKEIPAHLNVKAPNPYIPWQELPITLPDQTISWPTEQEPRVAGVSSFGWSGTNAHVLLEEYVPVAAPVTKESWQLLTLSARTETALEQVTGNLATFLQNHPDIPLADIAYTLQVGRIRLEHRRTLVCCDREDALAALTIRNPQRLPTSYQKNNQRAVAFLFPGLGEQYAGMAQELYQCEPAFRQTIDTCCQFLKERLEIDLSSVLRLALGSAGEQEHAANGSRSGQENGSQDVTELSMPSLAALLGRQNGHHPAAEERRATLQQTALAQPLVFIIEYALAQFLMKQWGIQPRALLGYSLGEYVEACLSGVFSLEDALLLVALRAQMIQQQPAGAMVAVALSEEAVQPYLNEHVSLAALNSRYTCVLAGPVEHIVCLEEQWSQQGIVARRVEATHAFHSTMLDPVRERLTRLVKTCTLHPPRIPYISNVTGTWITEEQATDPGYWAEHMCRTVRFADGVGLLLANEECALLEVGPGQSLGSFVKQHPACVRARMPMVVATLPTNYDQHSQVPSLLTVLGTLWQLGVPLRHQQSDAQHTRVALPTYPFERQRYWFEVVAGREKRALAAPQGKRADVGDWFYLPAWEKVPLASQVPQTEPRVCLLFVDTEGAGQDLAQVLEQHGHIAICVHMGTHFAREREHRFTVRPQVAQDYKALLHDLKQANLLPQTIVHGWSLVPLAQEIAGEQRFSAYQERGLYSLLFLAQALGSLIDDEYAEAFQIIMLSSGMQRVNGDEALCPEQATLLAACKVIPQEYQNISCRSIDLSASEALSAESLLAEVLAANRDTVVAYRGGERQVQVFAPLRLEQPGNSALALRERGVYLITGGLGGLGLVIGSYLARTVQARLVMLGRSPMLPRAEWQNWLEQHEEHDATSIKIKNIQDLEALGAEVLVLQADVADEAQMHRAIAQVEAHFGCLHGVIHAAGIFEEQAFGVIQEIDPVAVCEAHFRPKAYGTLALEAALGERPLDFCLLFSSLVSVLGGLAFVGYTAANAFMDALTYQHNQRSTVHWTSLGWDIWQVKEERHGVHRYGVMGSTVSLYSMSAQEGLDAFARLLAVKEREHIIVSTGDIQERIRRWIRLETVQESKQRTATMQAPRHARPALGTTYVPANDDYERQIAQIFQEELGIEQVGLYDNFFDLGGNSLLGLQVIARLKKAFHRQIPAVALFEAPTVSTLAEYLRPSIQVAAAEQKNIHAERRRRARQGLKQDGVAIIGMAGRFPGADNVEQFWQNLCNGVESITFFSDEELLAAGVERQLIQKPNYVKARPIMKNIDQFDANFFGYSPREAELTDPQHRFFLECAWEALELAGYDPYTYDGLISVFGGANISTYLLDLATTSDFLKTVDGFQIGVGNDKDSLTTTVSYKLNLKGPSFAVQTFCSTSLVATHLACQHLLHGECDIALAGGVSIRVPTVSGHLYQEGGMESPDGHCRTFDAQARGSIFGDGVSMVALKRFSDALADGDTIYAVIKGSAINNDGSLKVSYSAPSVAGQAAVVEMALANAGVDAASISYVEAHGTATELGDPIEVASLTRAYRTYTDRSGYCGIGSLKTNIGHLDRAAGATGLIKAALSLAREQIPPSLHYEAPNPEIDFEDSPFYVNTQLRPWKRGEQPRRAGVNSLGMGGTNAHVVLEEAPLPEPGSSSRPWQLLLLSARTETALEKMTANLHAYMQQHEDINLADIAYTLQAGRSAFEHRRIMVCSERGEALKLLQTSPGAHARVSKGYQTKRDRRVAFLFPGVGEQYVGLAQDLYEHEETFRATVDRCCALLKSALGVDLRKVMFAASPQNGNGHAAPEKLDLRTLLGRNGQNNGNGHSNGHGHLRPEANPASEQLRQTAMAQPAVFVVEYALACLLMEWGLQPQAMLGYSLGEYVAACLAGIFSLEDALVLVARRAQLIQALPEGAMLAVALSEEEIQPYLNEQVHLAIINARNTCILAGPSAALAQVEQRLSQLDISHRRVETTHAFHTPMLAEAREALNELAQNITLQAPRIPYISNVTGTWITPEEATDPEYWARHMCQTVRFADGVGHLLQDTDYLLLEVGPGQALGSFVRQHPACERERMQGVFSTLPAAHERQAAQATLLLTLGKLWLAGATIDWRGFSLHERRRRVPLPTYAFERQRYWLEPEQSMSTTLGAVKLRQRGNQQERKADLSDWFYLPTWKQAVTSARPRLTEWLALKRNWLILADESGIGAQIAQTLTEYGQDVTSVRAGSTWDRLDKSCYTLRPTARADYDALLKDLREQGKMPTHVLHLWTLSEQEGEAQPEQVLASGFHSLLMLAQALGDRGTELCTITVLSHAVYDVLGHETICPARATLVGPCRVIPQEYPNLTSHLLDIWLPDTQCPGWTTRLLEELSLGAHETSAALRGVRRWVPTFEPVAVPDVAPQEVALREQGVYLITGGLGGIGLALAEHLVRRVSARLVLVGRQGLPPRAEWEQLLAQQTTDERLKNQIRNIQGLEALGARILLMRADVANETEMRAVITETLATFGTLHGVFHAAGVPGVGLIQRKTQEQAEHVLRPKLQGTLTLEHVLAELSLDFLVLFSSITSTTGSPGQVDYCAANAFLDAYAQHNSHKHGRTVAIDWSEWQWNAWEDGMAGFGDMGTILKENRQNFGLSFQEGMEVLERALTCRQPRVVVSTQDFAYVVELSKFFTVATLLQEKRQEQQEKRVVHARPALDTSYIAPRNELERKIAALWEQLLGIEQVGISDNFFDLGGNSLLGGDLIVHMRKTFNIEDLPAYVLYEAPSVAAMAQYLEQSQNQAVSVSEKVHERSARRRESLKQRMYETRKAR
ncbi:MAG TPA: SDR family NAD(P)-dependent oxidoreductase [Ktedonobacteraceae bacterium]|nr:SDR family NAD(P)-dependent oxidoreductase [Ktedonobacteraceae bacterium]